MTPVSLIIVLNIPLCLHVWKWISSVDALFLGWNSMQKREQLMDAVIASYVQQDLIPLHSNPASMYEFLVKILY